MRAGSSEYIKPIVFGTLHLCWMIPFLGGFLGGNNVEVLDVSKSMNQIIVPYNTYAICLGSHGNDFLELHVMKVVIRERIDGACKV